MAKLFPTRTDSIEGLGSDRVIKVHSVTLTGAADHLQVDEGKATRATGFAVDGTSLNFYITPDSAGHKRIVNVDGGASGKAAYVFTLNDGNDVILS